jgi:hypothetical protein
MGIIQKKSSVFWKKTDYAYLIFTIIGGIAAAADLSISNWTKELQKNQIISDEIFSNLRDYVGIGVSECRRLEAQKDVSNAQHDDHVGGVIMKFNTKPHNSDQEDGFKKSYPNTKLLGVLPQFVDLTESDCAFLQRVSDAITSNSLNLMGFELQSYQTNGYEKTAKSPMGVIVSEVEEINNYSDRDDELGESLSSLKYLSILKALSPMLLGLGVGIRLARTHFDVKTEQEKQRCEAAGVPSPAITTTDDGGSASNVSVVSPPIDATPVGEAQD